MKGKGQAWAEGNAGMATESVISESVRAGFRGSSLSNYAPEAANKDSVSVVELVDWPCRRTHGNRLHHGQHRAAQFWSKKHMMNRISNVSKDKRLHSKEACIYLIITPFLAVGTSQGK